MRQAVAISAVSPALSLQVKRARDEALEMFGPDNVTLRRKLHQRLTPGELREVYMLGTAREAAEVILFTRRLDQLHKVMGKALELCERLGQVMDEEAEEP